SRVGTLATGSAPAFGRTLAPRYGSDLLTLRLLSLLQWGDPFFGPPQSRRFAGFARLARSPQSRLPCAPCSCDRGLLAGSSRRETQLRSGLRSSNQNPLG